MDKPLSTKLLEMGIFLVQVTTQKSFTTIERTEFFS